MCTAQVTDQVGDGELTDLPREQSIEQSRELRAAWVSPGPGPGPGTVTKVRSSPSFIYFAVCRLSFAICQLAKRQPAEVLFAALIE